MESFFSSYKPEPLLTHKCLLGEGPLWDEKNEAIIWVDIERGEIHEFSFLENKHRVFSVQQKIGTIALTTKGNYIVAMHHGFGKVSRGNGDIVMIADPEPDIPNNRFNDGKVDPRSRFWAGTMSLREEPEAGNVYVLNKDFSISKEIEKVTISNGMAWDVKRNKFYYIDTPTHIVRSYDFDPETGQISNSKPSIKIPIEEGSPDGMTIDNEGMLWIAHWGGYKVVRWNPLTGEKIGMIPLPVKNVTSCIFGGKDLNDLFITTASIGLNEEELRNQPLAGNLFVVKNCGFRGLKTNRFKVEKKV